MEQLLVWVKKLAVFMILCSYMEHLLPEQYKRYFHMCTGFILILMIASPLVQVLRGDMASEVMCLLEDFRIRSSVVQADRPDQEKYSQYYMAQYRLALEEQIQKLAEEEGMTVAQIEMSINEDAASECYGCLSELSMNLGSQKEDMVDGRQKNQLKRTLSQQLGVSESHIHLKDSRQENPD